jgi:hypothetical protein
MGDMAELWGEEGVSSGEVSPSPRAVQAFKGDGREE